MRPAARFLKFVFRQAEGADLHLLRFGNFRIVGHEPHQTLLIVDVSLVYLLALA